MYNIDIMSVNADLADLPAVLPGQDDLGRLCGRGRQALRQPGVPAVAQLEGDGELNDYCDCGGWCVFVGL